MGYVVTFTELIGGLLLMAGLLTRLAAIALTVDLVMAIVLIKSNVPLIMPTDKPGRTPTTIIGHLQIAAPVFDSPAMSQHG